MICGEFVNPVVKFNEGFWESLMGKNLIECWYYMNIKFLKNLIVADTVKTTQNYESTKIYINILNLPIPKSRTLIALIDFRLYSFFKIQKIKLWLVIHLSLRVLISECDLRYEIKSTNTQ